MTTPQLSPPTLFTPLELKANIPLSKSVTQVVNSAFYRSKQADPVKWNNTTSRFANEEALHAMLGGEGSVLALVFDGAGVATGDGETGGTKNNKKVVACAAAVPWKGADGRKKAPEERGGWEMKIVCVDGDATYHRRGLAVQLLRFLEEYLVVVERARLRRAGMKSGGVLMLWILATECINGGYWRRRGYQEVRRKVEGAGVWGCRTSFEMVVLRKNVMFDVGVEQVGGWL